ncbi:MAG: accessory factor UbiK family protein [Kiloniellales bacterium]|nr:accessory factor UbiK family protein [Kiloniellales bacterium]
MQSQNRLLDDLAKVATSAMGTLSGVREEVEAQVRQRLERVLGQMDLVTREEFDAVKAMAAKARAEQEALEARLAALEAKLAGKAGATKGRAAKPKAAKSAD